MGREVEVLSLGMMMRCKRCCSSGMIHGGSILGRKEEENRTNADSRRREHTHAADTLSFKLWV